MTFPQLAKISLDASQAHSPALENYFVEFSIAQQHYVLPLTKIERILRMVAVTPLPEAPPWVAGMIDLSGRATPVIDMRVRLGEAYQPPRLSDFLLVMDSVALWVDTVHQIREITPGQIDELPADLVNDRPFLAAIRFEDELILLLDAGRLIAYSGQSALDWALPEFFEMLEEAYPQDDSPQINDTG